MKRIFAALVGVCLIYLAIPSITGLNNVYAAEECDQVGDPCCYDSVNDYRYCTGSLTCDEALSPVQCVPAAFNCQAYCKGIGCQGGSCIDCPASGGGDCECFNCAVEEPPGGGNGENGGGGGLNLNAIQAIAMPGFKFGEGGLGSIVSELLNYLFPLAGLLLLLYLLFGGFQMMTSAGDPKKMEGAKQKLTNALVGFVIVFISYWLVQIAGRVLGIEKILEIF